MGNLTSQLFSNIYLNELDQFIKRELKVKYYLRYADDFIIIDNNKSKLESNLVAIRGFLNNKLKLEINIGKTFFRKWHQGIDFLGYVTFPYYSILRGKTKKRMFKKMKLKRLYYLKGGLNLEKFNQAQQSYLRLLSHANEHQTRLKLLE